MQKKTFLFFAFVLSFAFAFARNENANPYRLSYEVAADADEHKMLEVSVFNVAKKTISKLTLAFLFESDENPVDAETGADDEIESSEGIRTVEFEKAIFPKTAETFSIDLDGVNGCVDFVFVRKIVFSDETEWKDMYGLHARGG